MTNTEIALSTMTQRNTSSGIRLLRGYELRIFSRAAVDLLPVRPASTLPSDGIDVTGLGSWPRGWDGFMGSTLSDMCYSPVNAEAQLALGIWLKTGNDPVLAKSG